MTNEQTAQSIAYINSSWGNKPLDQLAARTWGAELQAYAFDAVISTLRALLREQDWRPSLAQILKPLAPASTVKSAEAAFESLWVAIGRHSKRGGLTELEQRAVKRLGGWGVVGRWLLTKRHWHLKNYREVYDDLVDSESALELRAIAGGQQRAIGGAS